MGYGSRALELLKQYYEMKILNISETLQAPPTEIAKVQDEEVNLLEERIGKHVRCSAYQIF